MAETSGFFQSVNGDRKYGSAFLAAREAALVTNGIHNNELNVTPGGGMDLILAYGRAWINGYFYLNDLAKTLTVATADGSLPRVDSVVIRWSLDERTMTARVITGAPSAAPAAPAVVRNSSTYDLKLCEIRIPAGTTELTLDMITDTRLDGEVCGIVSGTLGDIDFAEYYKYMQAQFDVFMDSLEGVLGEDTAGNLLLQINEVKDDVDALETVHTLAHSKSGTVHSLSGLNTDDTLASIQFKATAAYTAGDTFRVDGTAYAPKMPNGKVPDGGFFVAGALVSAILDTEGGTVNFKGGGGLSDSDLALANATAAKVFSGFKFYAGDKTLKTGTAVPYYYQTFNKKITKESTSTFTATGNTIVVAVAFLTEYSGNFDYFGGEPGAIVGTHCLTDRVGHSIGSGYSVSGNVISITTDEDDVEDFGDPYLMVYIVSK